VEPASRASVSSSFILRRGSRWTRGNCSVCFCRARKEMAKPAAQTDSWTRLPHGRVATGRFTMELRIRRSPDTPKAAEATARVEKMAALRNSDSCG